MPRNNWITNKIKDWRFDDEVGELLDASVPYLIEYYIKTHYSSKVFEKYLEYSKPSVSNILTYKLERSIKAYDRMISEKLIKHVVLTNSRFNE